MASSGSPGTNPTSPKSILKGLLRGCLSAVVNLLPGVPTNVNTLSLGALSLGTSSFGTPRSAAGSPNSGPTPPLGAAAVSPDGTGTPANTTINPPTAGLPGTPPTLPSVGISEGASQASSSASASIPPPPPSVPSRASASPPGPPDIVRCPEASTVDNEEDKKPSAVDDEEDKKPSAIPPKRKHDDSGSDEPESSDEDDKKLPAKGKGAAELNNNDTVPCAPYASMPSPRVSSSRSDRLFKRTKLVAMGPANKKLKMNNGQAKKVPPMPEPKTLEDSKKILKKQDRNIKSKRTMLRECRRAMELLDRIFFLLSTIPAGTKAEKGMALYRLIRPEITYANEDVLNLHDLRLIAENLEDISGLKIDDMERIYQQENEVEAGDDMEEDDEED